MDELMTAMKFGVGQPVRRVEDDRLVRGAGRYTSDVAPEGALFAHFVRSPHAHARFAVGDLETARAAPGVKAVYVASDVSHLGDLPCLAPTKNSDGTQTPLKPYPVMAKDEAQHVGDIVAMIVADSDFAAKDAAEALAIDWEARPAVADAVETLRPDAAQVFGGAPGNVAYDAHYGDRAKTDEALARAAHVVKIGIVNPRVAANYMEPRGAVGSLDPESGRLTLHVGSQGVHLLRNVLARAVLKIPPTDLKGRHLRRRRRVRHTSFFLPGIPAHSRGRAPARPAGPLAGRPVRALCRRRAWAGQRDHSGDGPRPGGPVPGPAPRHHRQSRGLSLAVRSIRAVARGLDVDRPLSDRHVACAGAWRLPTRSRWTPIAARAAPKRLMSSSGWSTAARANSGSRRRRSGSETSCRRTRCLTRPRPTAPMTSAISVAL